MSSFSYQVKKEVASILPSSQDEALSELSAIIKTSGEISLAKDKKIICKTEIKEVADKINYILNMLYGKTAMVSLSADNSFNKKDRYQLDFPTEITQQVLLDTEIMYYDETYLCFNSGISKYIVAEESLSRAYIKGAFESAFTCNISLSEASATAKNTGYHAEFVFNSEQLAQDFSLLLADFELISKIVERKNAFVVYIKDCEMISDLLSLVGASQGVFDLQNENVLRSIRNNANRQTNCISANIAKTVDASVRQMEAIKTIDSLIGLDKLDQSLLDAVNLRLANPEESLDNLVKLSTNNISKSGLYHRFQKLEKIAKELKQ